ncbi:hypothetical protein L195_g059781, partial [Trifolium pratense]
MVAEKDLKTTAFENSQSHGGSFYGADNSYYNMNYYQESASPQVPHSVPGVQYPDSYEHPFDPGYGSGYNAPAP